MKPTDIQYEAIDQWDTQFDTLFYYGVTTTRIVCKPSCHSRTPKRTNIVIFDTLEEARMSGYRYCKRCCPDIEDSDTALVNRVTKYIRGNYHLRIVLEEIAKIYHISPYVLHRKFKQIKGITMHTYLLQTRMKEAKALLTKTNLSISTIGSMCGIPNASGFSKRFKEHCDVSPKEYRKESRDEKRNTL